MSSLQGYVDRRVFLVLQDGRAIVVRVNSFFSFFFFRRVFRLVDGISDMNLFLGYSRWLRPKIKYSSLRLQGACFQHG